MGSGVSHHYVAAAAPSPLFFFSCLISTFQPFPQSTLPQSLDILWYPLLFEHVSPLNISDSDEIDEIYGVEDWELL